MVQITPTLVAELIRIQFPQWAHLSITPVQPGGWDNRTFHLGDHLSIRLPSAQRYAAQVPKEQKWLPFLAPQLPKPIPAPIAQGTPTANYPYQWSIYRWLPGKPASSVHDLDQEQFALDLADFLQALYSIDSAGGPSPGLHNFFRGGDLSVYEAETFRAINILTNQINSHAALAVWEAARRTSWQRPPVWVHGDIAPGNLLVQNGRLSAVIDFGCAAVGDPASDLTIAWTYFTNETRTVFQRALPFDSDTWDRARGWALWKALILTANQDTPPAEAARAQMVLQALLHTDHFS